MMLLVGDAGRPEIEAEIQRACRAKRWHDASARALTVYGGEIMSYLYAMLHHEADASDAFAQWSLMMWEGLPRFRWESTFRTWSYVLARRALARMHEARVRRRREVSLSPDLDELAARVRSQTLEYLKTDVKSRVEQVRAELDADDQTILILRVDRKLSWQEIAHITADDDVDPDTLARRVVALRKRFERIKETIRQRVRAA